MGILQDTTKKRTTVTNKHQENTPKDERPQVMAALMEADEAAVCGPRGRHDPERATLRHGSERGSVTLGGRRVGVDRQRMRAADGAGEAPAPAYELFSSSEILGRMAMGKMRDGRLSRRYTVRFEPVGENVGRALRARASRGLTPVRGDDSDRLGRAARHTAGQVGPGGVDDRQCPLW